MKASKIITKALTKQTAIIKFFKFLSTNFFTISLLPIYVPIIKAGDKYIDFMTSGKFIKS